MSYSSGILVSPEAVEEQSGWQFSIPEWNEIPGNKRDRFLKRPMLHSTQSGATADLSFTGTAVGAYVVAGPDAGRLDYRIDDGDWKTVELYHRFSKGLHYPRTVIFEPFLTTGKHQLKVRLADNAHPESKGTAARIIAFTVNQ